MASTSMLTVYTKANPAAYGPLALAGHLAQDSGNEGAVTVEYEEKSADDATESCRLEIKGCAGTRLAGSLQRSS